MGLTWWVILTVAAAGGPSCAAFVDDGASLLQVAEMAEQAIASASPGTKEIPTDQLLAISPPRSLLEESYVDLVDDDGDGGGEVDDDDESILETTSDNEAATEAPKDDDDGDMKEIFRMSWPQPTESMRPVPKEADSLAQKTKSKADLLAQKTKSKADSREQKSKSKADSREQKTKSKAQKTKSKPSEVPTQHLHTRQNVYDAKTAAREKRQLKHMHVLAVIILIIFAVTATMLTVLRACVHPEPSPFLRSGRSTKRSTSAGNSSRRSSQFAASAASQPVKAQ